jgi:hypothetical protein
VNRTQQPNVKVAIRFNIVRATGKVEKHLIVTDFLHLRDVDIAEPLQPGDSVEILDKRLTTRPLTL